MFLDRCLAAEDSFTFQVSHKVQSEFIFFSVIKGNGNILF